MIISKNSQAIKIVADLIGQGIRSFALALMTLEILWGILLCTLCFWIASNGSMLRGIIAISLCVIAVSIIAIIVALYFSASSVVRKGVKEHELGKLVFDSLFEHALGVSGEDTGEQPDNAKIKTHLTKAEVEKILNDAAKELLNEDIASNSWSAPAFWLANKIKRISVWACVKVIVKSCSQDGDSVNLFELRDRLSSTIDDAIISFLKQYFTRLTFSLISSVSTVSILLSFGIRQISFNPA